MKTLILIASLVLASNAYAMEDSDSAGVVSIKNFDCTLTFRDKRSNESDKITINKPATSRNMAASLAFDELKQNLQYEVSNKVRCIEVPFPKF